MMCSIQKIAALLAVFVSSSDALKVKNFGDWINGALDKISHNVVDPVDQEINNLINGTDNAFKCSADPECFMKVYKKLTNKCTMCQMALSTLEKKSLCSVTGGLAGAAMCETIGLGPEDPLADVCAVSVGAMCSAIASNATKGLNLTNKQICQGSLLNFCPK